MDCSLELVQLVLADVDCSHLLCHYRKVEQEMGLTVVCSDSHPLVSLCLNVKHLDVQKSLLVTQLARCKVSEINKKI